MYNKIYLNHFLSKSTPSFGDEDTVEIEPKTRISEGEVVNMFSISLSNNHIGTHIDLPKHFYNSEKGVEFYDPSTWRFEKVSAINIPVSEADLISHNQLPKNINRDIELLIIKTGYEKYRNQGKYWNDNPGLAPKMADFLRKNFPNLRAVGFDFISLTSWRFKKEGIEAHLNFLDPEKGEILIIEDMKLSEINSSKILSVDIIPWMIKDLDSAPVTIIAETK